MMPPWRPGWRGSRSQRRAACQSLAACLRDIATNRTEPATLPRHTGQGARVCGLGKPGRAAEIESKGASGVAAQPARKRLALGAPCRCTPKGLAKIGEVGKDQSCQRMIFPGLGRTCRPALRGGFLLMGVSL